MQNYKKLLLRVACIVLAVLPTTALRSQNNSLNAFSPYTFYGIGDLSTQGPGYIRSMGGAGIGYRNALKINYMNPASYSVMRQKSFLFNVEIEGNNTYFKSPVGKTSHNSFNVRDISLAFPLAHKLGLGVSVTPLSNVGYRIDMTNNDPQFLGNNMDVTYKYAGEGTVIQAKMGLGIQLGKRLSLGADLIYYHGELSRYFNTTITSILSSETFSSLEGTAQQDISRLGTNFGLQYDMIVNEDRILTFGATFQPRTNLKPDVSRTIYGSTMYPGAVIDTMAKSDLYLPTSFTAGFSYQTVKWSMGLDYSSQFWGNAGNADEAINSVSFKNSQFLKLGVQYTPNAGDSRHVLNRWSYRVGFRYNNYYMRINDRNITDKAITLGVGIPIRAAISGTSSINVGFEYGWRGRSEAGQIGTRTFNMLREKYVKLSVGFMLFGEDDWFNRFKYQ